MWSQGIGNAFMEKNSHQKGAVEKQFSDQRSGTGSKGAPSPGAARRSAEKVESGVAQVKKASRGKVSSTFLEDGKHQGKHTGWKCGPLEK
jgi:hypothetical protein